MSPLEQFAKQRKIGFDCTHVFERPDGLMSDSPRHFKIRLTQGNRGFSLYFSQGSAYTQDPTLADVLECLADDASGYENAKSAVQYNREKNQGDTRTAFDEWANEYGYDTDSRSAEKIFRTVKRQAEQLKRVLGEDNYNYLLWDVMTAQRDEENAAQS